jgi:hypothetical protein
MKSLILIEILCKNSLKKWNVKVGTNIDTKKLHTHKIT